MRLLDSAMSQIQQDFTITLWNSPSCARPANEIKKFSRFRGLRQRQSLLKLFHQVLNDYQFRQTPNATAIYVRISQHEDEDEQWGSALYPARAGEGRSSLQRFCARIGKAGKCDCELAFLGLRVAGTLCL